MKTHNKLIAELKNELDFCKEIEAEKNEHGNYIYISADGNDMINLPYILQEYKEWLLVNNMVQ